MQEEEEEHHPQPRRAAQPAQEVTLQTSAPDSISTSAQGKLLFGHDSGAKAQDEHKPNSGPLTMPERQVALEAHQPQPRWFEQSPQDVKVSHEGTLCKHEFCEEMHQGILKQ